MDPDTTMSHLLLPPHAQHWTPAEKSESSQPPQPQELPSYHDEQVTPLVSAVESSFTHVSRCRRLRQTRVIKNTSSKVDAGRKRLRRAHAPHKLGLGSDCAVLDRGTALGLGRARHDSVIVAFDCDGGALVPGRALSRGAQARQRQQQYADDAARRVSLVGAALLLRRRHRAGCCPVFTRR